MTSVGAEGAKDADSEISGSSSSSWFHQLLDKVKSSVTGQSSPASRRSSEFSSGGSEKQVPVEAKPPSHENGTCNPCVLVASRMGCRQGDQCLYCHQPHPEKMKVPHRPRKQTRDKYKLAIHKVIQDHEDSVEKAQEDLQEMARRSPYLRNLLHGILNAMSSAPAESQITTNSEGAVLRTPGPQPMPPLGPPPGLTQVPAPWAAGPASGHFLDSYMDDSEDETAMVGAVVASEGGYGRHVMDSFAESGKEMASEAASSSQAPESGKSSKSRNKLRL
ncbi:hypothetical protein AK812_SmicGene1606 [Symbiodinium microadriaticum]|uniref:Uncharacterized protein n=1 Tax=Symbiodinium microadriaticum TaxID=2951 RepID=A0A1Q9F3L4_SYMMI|nr:hypothetical protein AK812_SmicGene1606 [Symbiodinium microadriaticum]CAE7273592.1 unnamed protein product [Symbiodinium microadriaticum]